MDETERAAAWAAQARAVERIMARVVVTDTGCWEYQGARTPLGYGRQRVGAATVGAHRVMLSQSTQRLALETPREVVTLHQCDNPPCVNPDHLRWGTTTDNNRDTVAKGRHRGQKRGQCPRGHWLIGANLVPIQLKLGRRSCQVCNRARNMVYDRASRESSPISLVEAIAHQLARDDDVARAALYGEAACLL